MLNKGIWSSELVHTYSIVARDPATGALGVAVQSHWFAVGRAVCWAEAGVGAIATQARMEVSYGPQGLARLRAGVAPAQALAELLGADPGRELRQVAMVDCQGHVAVHTGALCIAEAGHLAGDGFSVQANIMANREVWPAMAQAYEAASGDLADRMMAALEAAQEMGGDLRGMQSAAMLIVKASPSVRPWEDTLVDLRVDDHPAPLVELRRLVRLDGAYAHKSRGNALLTEGQLDQALAEWRIAAEMAPDLPELLFWHAVALTELGRLPEALPIYGQAFCGDPNLTLLAKRLPAVGLLPDDSQLLEAILSQSCHIE